MVWFIVIIALALVTLAFIEWRLWNKPQPELAARSGGGDPYRYRYSARPLAGASDFDQRHPGGRDFDQRHD